MAYFSARCQFVLHIGERFAAEAAAGDDISIVAINANDGPEETPERMAAEAAMLRDTFPFLKAGRVRRPSSNRGLRVLWRCKGSLAASQTTVAKEAPEADVCGEAIRSAVASSAEKPMISTEPESN